MTAAAFKGTYADFKLIKTRGVVSISFEVPVEQAQTVLDVLGGMPVAATEVWCAIARLTNPGADAEQPLAPTTKAVASPASAVHVPNREFDSPDRGQPEKTKTAFRDMRPANQAGILCATPAFQKFLSERPDWFLSERPEPDALHDPDRAADYVRNYCGVKTRADIRPRTPSGDRWKQLFDKYQAWMNAPEFADA